MAARHLNLKKDRLIIVRCFPCPLESVINHVYPDYNINRRANDHTPFYANTLFYCYRYVLPSYKEHEILSSQVNDYYRPHFWRVRYEHNDWGGRIALKTR